MKRVLLLGGSGFVGSSLREELGRRGYVVILASSRAREGHLLLNLAEPQNFDACLQEASPDWILNAGGVGISPLDQATLTEYFAVNSIGVYELQKSAARGKVRKFIHLGSCFEYGHSDHPITEETPLRPSTAYAISKAAGSALLEMGARESKLPTLNLRLFGIWGPGEAPTRLVPQIIRAAKENSEIPLSTGDQERDFSFVGDMCRWIVDVAERAPDSGYQVYNIASGDSIRVIDFAKKVATALNVQDRLRPGVLPQRPGDMRRLVCDPSKLKNLLTDFSVTDFQTALRMMVKESP